MVLHVMAGSAIILAMSLMVILFIVGIRAVRRIENG